MRALSVIGLIAGLAALPVQAAVVTESFNFSALPGYASGSTLNFTSGDLTLAVKAFNYDTPVSVGEELDTNSAYKVTRQHGYGLYVNYSGDNDHRIDGYYNEILTFGFNKDVKITSISFGSIADGSVYDFYIGDTYAGADDVDPTVTPVAGVSDIFGIGASADGSKIVCIQTHYNKWTKKTECKKTKKVDYYSAFKITGLTVSYTVKDPDPEVPPVPLPAAGVLMVGALGGLAALRRRRK